MAKYPNTLMIHLILLCSLTYYNTSSNLSFYNIFITTVNIPLLHLLHISFICYLIYTITESIIFKYYGSLRIQERSMVNDQMFLFLTDILLVLTVFNKDINYRNMVVFFIILCTKSILWVSTIRMDHDIDMKMVFCNMYTAIFSLIFCTIFWSKTNILFLFTFEFGTIVLSSIKNICILLIKLRDTDTNKSLLIFYTDIIHLSSLLVLYIIFIVVTSIQYKVPLNVFRSSVSILEKLIKKIKSYTRYIKICKELERIPDVRDEGDCPICTDEMELSKKLKCGHVFHLECLKQWCERQSFCPICKVDLCLSSSEEIIYQGDEILTGVEVDIAE